MSKIIDEKYLGPEPLLSKDSVAIDIIRFYNWHNYFHNSDDAKSFVIDYYKKIKADKELIKKLNKIEPDLLRTVGWNCRNLLLGGELPQKSLDYINDTVNKLVSKIDSIDDEPEEKFNVTIQERIENKISEIIATLEDYVDDFACDGKASLDVEYYFRNQTIKPVIAKRIADYYRPLYAEIYDALEGNDEQIKEAYDGWNRKTLKAYMEFVKSIITTADIYSITTKIDRKPRKKKVKPAALVVKKLKYKEKDDETNITSIVPSLIVGADQLWAYNTKSRALSVYNALGPVGLSVKGTTITGYDEKTSITKKLRKPEETLPRVLEGGKLVLRKLMDELTTTAKEASGRINIDTILLRTIK